MCLAMDLAALWTCKSENGSQLAVFSKYVTFTRHFIAPPPASTLPPYRSAHAQ